MKTNDISFALMCLFSTTPIISIRGINAFILFQIIFIFTNLNVNKKRLHINTLYFLFFLSMLFTVYFIGNSGISNNWKTPNNNIIIKQFILLLAYIFSSTYITSTKVSLIKKFFCYAIIIHFLWSILQFFLFSWKGIDLNDLIFNQILHTRDSLSTSVIVDNVIRPTGLSWHTSNFIPLIAIGYFLCPNIYIRLMLLCMAIFSSSSTSIITFILCTLLNLTDKKTNSAKFKKKKIIYLTITLILILLLYNNFSELINNSVIRSYERISSSILFEGTPDPHLAYYLTLPDVWDKMSLTRKLFGFGPLGSGYMYNLLYNRFNYLDFWVVESDIINILLGFGITGFLLFYSWLFYTAKKGWKIDRKYTYIFIVLIISGFFYNIQGIGIVMMEMILSNCIYFKINIFSKSV